MNAARWRAPTKYKGRYPKNAEAHNRNNRVDHQQIDEESMAGLERCPTNAKAEKTMVRRRRSKYTAQPMDVSRHYECYHSGEVVTIRMIVLTQKATVHHRRAGNETGSIG